MKKIISVILAAALTLGLAACGGKTAASGQEQKTYKIGVIQYATHPSLDNIYKGFLEGLNESGLKEGENITINFQNAQGDKANGDMQAKNMATANVNLIMGIATPAAMSAYSAAKEKEIPVIFSAVSDPLAAGLVKSLEAPGTGCTGTSDVLNLEAQLKMIRAFLKDAKKIGIIYTTSEANSVSQLEQIKKIAPNYGFEIEAVGVTNASEVATAAASVVAKGADCINNFTDNNVVDNLSTVLHEANAAGIPVFGSEVEQVKNGCLASESIDYVELGRETGRMAAKVLTGKADINTLAVKTFSTCTPVYNEKVMKALSLALPSDYSNAEAVKSGS
ncbi:MAG: ABC transporter substrate-binding protein [Bacillota bacterium]|nr:ABC transporter substrate-binding protein [Bacillota bacterium]